MRIYFFLFNKNNSVKVIYFFTELGKSKGSFLDAMKNINIPRVPINTVTSIAYRRELIPKLGSNMSLKIPVVSGPKPKPIIFRTKKRIAEVSARIAGGTIE